MNKSLLGIAMCAAAGFAAAADAQDQASAPPPAAATQQITRAGEQASTAGLAEYFTGRARVDPLFPVNESINASGAYVTFEPGARSNWHTHPAGQRLVVTSGVGLTQEWGKPVQEIRPGDVVVCPPGVKHWLGAAPTIAMTHLAVTGAVDGRSVVWMEKVTAGQCKALSVGLGMADLAARNTAGPLAMTSKSANSVAYGMPRRGASPVASFPPAMTYLLLE